jgi:hypothetical protein
MEDWQIYQDMLQEIGIPLVDTEDQQIQNTASIQAPLYRVCYPDDWILPSRTHIYENYDMVTKKYIPYKRLSHFREHLNRLNYCQDVHIPPAAWIVTCHTLSNLKDTSQSYHKLALALKEKKLSKYNEHIHHLISKYSGTYLNISYDDRRLMCEVFVQIEQQFSRNNTQSSRKNMISYYIVTQSLLYMLHYHTYYKLPSLRDMTKQKHYYKQVLLFISRCKDYTELMFIHTNRKRECQHCCNQVDIAFDTTLKTLL